MKYVTIVVGVIAVLVVGFTTVKQVSPVSWGWWGTTYTSSGAALGGYDPIAYFDGGVATLGDPEISFEYQDATWHFAGELNKTKFVENPEMYAPQFGSFCAFAVSKGFTAKPAPDAWHIENGRLYVFADQNVRDEWVELLDEGSLEISVSNWATR